MRTTRSKSFSPWMTCVAAWPPMAACTTVSDVVDVDAVAGDLGPVGVDGQARLAEFAHHGQLGEAGRAVEHALDLDGFASRARPDPGR